MAFKRVPVYKTNLKKLSAFMSTIKSIKKQKNIVSIIATKSIKHLEKKRIERKL